MATYIITDSGNAVTNMANAQAQLNTMLPGDILQLTKAVNFDGTLTLPAKAVGDATITITTTGTLPAAGTRIAPADSGELPQIRVIVNNASAIKTCDPAAGVANGYALIGLELIDNAFGGSTLLNLGSASTSLANKQDTAAKVPGWITVDRCLIHGQSSTVGTKRGIALHGQNLTVTECYIYNVFAIGADTQAIGGWNGLGNYTITNNYLEAAGENVMMGGADPIILNLVPTTLTFSRNDCVKLLAWMTDGFGRQVKNLFELKNFSNAHIFGNKFFYCWTDAQPGYPILFTPVNQDGTNTVTVVRDVIFELNEIAHVPGGINITSHDGQATPRVSARTENLTIQNNLFWDMGPTWGNALRVIQTGNGSSVNTFEGTADLVVNHNTFLGEATMNAPLYFYSKSATFGYAAHPDFVFQNNLTRKSLFGIKGDSAAEGTTTLADYAPGYVCTKNAIAEAVIGSYPAGNYGPTEVFFEAQFVNYAGGDYHIDPGSAYHLDGTDGLDLGADIDAIAAAYGGTGAISFDTGDYLSRSTGLLGVGACTMMCWYKRTGGTPTGAEYRTVFVTGNPAGAYDSWAGIFSSVASNDINVSVGAGGSSAFTTGLTFADDTWTHLAYVRSGTTHRFYVNGSLYATCTLNFAAATIDNTFLASDTVADSIGGHAFEYYREWGYALAQSQIQLEMISWAPSASAVATDTPLSDATDLTDDSGNGHDWTGVGSLATVSGYTLPTPTPLLVGSLPYTTTLTATDFDLGTYGNIPKEAFLQIVAPSNDYVGWTPGYDTADTMHCTYYRADPVLGLILTQDSGTRGAGWHGPMVAGDTYYVWIRTYSSPLGHDIPILVTSVTSTPTLTPGETIIINDDHDVYADGTTYLPACVMDLEGNVIGLMNAPPNGEMLAALGDGTTIWEDVETRYGTQLALFDTDMVFVAAPETIPPIPATPESFRLAQDGTKFWVFNSDNNGLYSILPDGTVSALQATIAAIPSAMNVLDGILYYVVNGDEFIYRHDLTTDTPLANLGTLPAVPATLTKVAITPNGQPGDLLVLPNGSAVTFYEQAGLGLDTLVIMDAAGDSTTYVYDGTARKIDHLDYADDTGTAVVVWWFYQAVADTARIASVNVADGTENWGFDIPLFAEGVNGAADASSTDPFGPSNSCDIVLFRFGATPPPPPPTPSGLNVRTLRMKWLRRSPHLIDENTRMFYAKFELAMNVGSGLLETQQGDNPDVMLRWSDDGGHTWSNEHWRKSGKRGEFKRRVRWLRLGQGRDRVFEVSGSDPVAVALVMGWLDVEKGLS